MRHALLFMLEVPGVIRRVQLRMLEAVDGGLYLLELLDVLESGDDALCANLYTEGCGS